MKRNRLRKTTAVSNVPTAQPYFGAILCLTSGMESNKGTRGLQIM